MPVGVVAVPIVVVLKRSSAHTKRNCIDTATKIKLISGEANSAVIACSHNA